MIQRLQRAWAFGRHISPLKIVRRLQLGVLRKTSDLRGPRQVAKPDAQLFVVFPEPVFPPRLAKQVTLSDTAWTFTFLGKTVEFEPGKIDWTAPGPEPEHQLWRMNLHYMEYLEATDDAAFSALVTAWLDANDTLQPKAWRDSWNAYALSIRVVVWMQQMGARPDLDTDLRTRMGDSIARQIEYLTHHLETDIGGNHLTKNIKALIWGTQVFQGKAPARWGSIAWKLLDRQLKIQILEDGVHYERSPAYHCQVFADLLECYSVLAFAPPDMKSILKTMAQAIADMAHPDGHVAQFNDAGLTMAYAPAVCLKAFEDARFASVSPRGTFAFESAGYYGYRDDQMYFVADCGPLAPDDLPAHGHGDILSFELSLGAERVIVDQGVFEYISGSKRHQSRTCAAHNTVSVPGQDQADFYGAFRFGRRTRPQVVKADAKPESLALEGRHDGFKAAKGSPTINRRFHVDKNGVEITDQLDATSVVATSAGLLLHPGVSVESKGENALFLRLKSGNSLYVECDQPLIAEPAVWWPDMGVEHSTTRIVCTVKDARNSTTLRILYDADAAPNPLSQGN